MMKTSFPLSLLRPRLGRAVSLAVLTSIALTHAASAHAILIDSEPAINAAVPPGHVTMRLRYNSRIDHARSRLTLTRPDRTQSVLATPSSDPVDILSTAADLGPGSYTLRWQVLAVDGHITRGDVPFTVAAPAAPTAPAPPAAQAGTGH